MNSAYQRFSGLIKEGEVFQGDWTGVTYTVKVWDRYRVILLREDSIRHAREIITYTWEDFAEQFGGMI